jgi:hypothetical protein
MTNGVEISIRHLSFVIRRLHLLARTKSSKTGCFPHYPKKLNLIYYINHAEIVKNFTNFACGVGGEKIRFRRHQNSRFTTFVRMFDGFTVFCIKKTIDGERFLERIRVSHWLGLFVVGN